MQTTSPTSPSNLPPPTVSLSVQSSRWIAVASLLALIALGLAWELVVADDGSSDATVGLVQECFLAVQAGAGPAGRLLDVGPRPEGERWCGKNWPASQAAALEWP